jgi:hypothetical protein
MPEGGSVMARSGAGEGVRKNCTLVRLSLLAGEHVRWSTPDPLTLRENERAEPIRVRKVEGSIMHSLTRKIELRLIETSPLPIPIAILACLVTLNVVSAVLALLAA